MIGKYGLFVEFVCSKPIELVSLHLHLVHLVVILDTEASYNRKPVGAK
jgi:hypothetical protein